MTEIVLNNGLKLTFEDADGQFRGISRVSAGSVELRSCIAPAFVEISTPDGVQFSEFQVISRNASPVGVEYVLSAMATRTRLMEWMLHEARPRLSTTDFIPEANLAEGTTLKLVIEPVNRTVGGAAAAGFSYQYYFDSPEFQIYKILDRATWEIGGKAVDNTFWLRNSFAPAVYAISDVSQAYSTEWYLPSSSNPNVFQFLPWQTTLEGFSMTTHARGALITWATRVGHIRSLFEKRAGEDELRHWHEHCGDLSYHFSTIPMEVLWLPGSGNVTDWLNTYEDVRDIVYQTLHDEIGMRRERALSYGVIEEWGVPDMDRYRTVGLPKLHEAGVKTVFLPNEFQNNMNTFGVSNMCCTVDYKAAETVGEEKLKRFCDEARHCGIIVEMWANTALSTLTYIFAMRDHDKQRINFLPIEGSVVEVIRNAKDPWVRTAFGSIEADHYTPVFAQLNLRDPDIRAYWMQQWKYAHDVIGLRQFFLDSSFNMTSDKFHWAANPAPDSTSGGTVDQTHLLGAGRPPVEPEPRILSQYRAHLDLMVEMQKAGYIYSGEDLGVFGIHRSGPGIIARLDSLPLWSDSLANFDIMAIVGAGCDPDFVYFAGFSYRMVWQIHWDINADELSFHNGFRRSDQDAPSEWHLSVMRAYNDVVADMDKRTILPGEKGVLYYSTGGRIRILWAFEAFEFTLDGAAMVLDVMSGDLTLAREVVLTSSYRVYCIRTVE